MRAEDLAGFASGKRRKSPLTPDATQQVFDVDVGVFPKVDDLSSLDPDKNHWLTRGVLNISASVVRGENLWVAWDAAASTAGDTPFYPNAHVRLARIDLGTWTTVEERQV